jgi:hypothetical protein
MRKAYLAKMAELTCGRQEAGKTCSLGKGEQAKEAIICAIGLSFIPPTGSWDH